MLRKSIIIAEDQNSKLNIILSLDDKGLPGQNSGRLASITNRYFEQLMEFYNANELHVPIFCTPVGPQPKAKKKK